MITKRDEWEFKYDVDVVLSAAQVKRDYHRKREDWWKIRREEKIAQIKSEGLTIDESVAEGYNLSNAYGRDAVLVDTKLQADVQECNEKLKEHRDIAETYSNWCLILSNLKLNTSGSHQLLLCYDDWKFFFKSIRTD